MQMLNDPQVFVTLHRQELEISSTSLEELRYDFLYQPYPAALEGQ